MSDPNNPQSTSTSDSDQSSVVDAFRALTEEVRALKAAGAPKEDAIDTIATRNNLDPVALAKQIDEAEASGVSRGEATMNAVTKVAGSMAAATLDRDGRREVAALVHSRSRIPGTKATLADAFSEHGTKFRSWLGANGYTYAQLADAERAENVFRYFINSHTDFADKQQEKELASAREEAKTKAVEELTARTPRPVAPSLPSGGHAEGGVLKRLATAALDASAEPTDDQAEIMSNLGLDEAAQKRAMDSHRKKTALGTPLDFVPTRNAAGV